ncbi:MAG: hypothetical protein QM764_21640 [Chitinophagaceae bacterium]
MEKILLVVNAEFPNHDTIEFACYLANLTRSTLTGVFLENLAEDEVIVVREEYAGKERNWELDNNSDCYREKHATIEKNINLFISACEKHSLRYSIHTDTRDPLRETIEESRYADILIVDPAITFKRQNRNAPGKFVASILKDAQCPVIIAPQHFGGIDEIIFTYDGSKASFFAIKQFAYLFPELDEKKVMVIHSDDTNEGVFMKNKKFREWISNHYSSIGFERFQGNSDKELPLKLSERKNAMIVRGGSDWSLISQLIRYNDSEALAASGSLPVFIANY